MKYNPNACRVEDALSILVGKWKPLILLHLLNEGTQRFNELKRSIPGITQKNANKAIARIRGRRYY